MNLYEQLSSLINELRLCVKSLSNNGTNLAKKEKEYKERLRIEVLKLKDEGTPATLIDKLVYGVPEVSQLRYERDVAETKYKANLEAIGSTKIQIRCLEDKINNHIQDKNED